MDLKKSCKQYYGVSECFEFWCRRRVEKIIGKNRVKRKERKYRVIGNDCLRFNNLSYTIHLR